jgi:hypothetical protein
MTTPPLPKPAGKLPPGTLDRLREAMRPTPDEIREEACRIAERYIDTSRKCPVKDRTN